MFFLFGYTTPTRNRNVSQLYAISRNVDATLATFMDQLDARASQTRVRQHNLVMSLFELGPVIFGPSEDLVSWLRRKGLLSSSSNCARCAVPMVEGTRLRLVMMD